jgi:predicted hydrocarbon binding protein
MKEKVLDSVGENLTAILEGVALKYRKECGNFISIIPGLTNATAIALAPQLFGTIKDVGKMLGEQVLSNFVEASNLAEALTKVKNLLESTKFGRIEVISLKEEEASFRVWECADCGGLPNVGRPLCAFDEGVVEGILQAVLGKHFLVKETRCWGTGDGFCEFEVTLS